MVKDLLKSIDRDIMSGFYDTVYRGLFNTGILMLSVYINNYARSILCIWARGVEVESDC